MTITCCYCCVDRWYSLAAYAQQWWMDVHLISFSCAPPSARKLLLAFTFLRYFLPEPNMCTSFAQRRLLCLQQQMSRAGYTRVYEWVRTTNSIYASYYYHTCCCTRAYYCTRKKVPQEEHKYSYEWAVVPSRRPRWLSFSFSSFQKCGLWTASFRGPLAYNTHTTPLIVPGICFWELLSGVGVTST